MTKTLTLAIKLEMTEELFADGDLTLDEVNKGREARGKSKLEMGDFDEVEVIITDVPEDVDDSEVVAYVAGAYDLPTSQVSVKEVQ